MIYGVDPGFSGAVAFYDAETGHLEVHDMPVAKNKKGKTELLHPLLWKLLDGDASEVWIEQVGAMPGQGVSSMFRFGQCVGAIHMAAAGQGLPVRLVTPAVWKRHFGLVKEKGAARGLACQRFPKHAHLFNRAKDDGRAEAALIALYGAEVSK